MNMRRRPELAPGLRAAADMARRQRNKWRVGILEAHGDDHRIILSAYASSLSDLAKKLLARARREEGGQ